MSDRGVLFSVWNLTKNNWATLTNYSTEKEATDLLVKIRAACRDNYTVYERTYGSIRETPPEWKQ